MTLQRRSLFDNALFFAIMVLGLVGLFMLSGCSVFSKFSPSIDADGTDTWLQPHEDVQGTIETDLDGSITRITIFVKSAPGEPPPFPYLYTGPDWSVCDDGWYYSLLRHDLETEPVPSGTVVNCEDGHTVITP